MSDDEEPDYMSAEFLEQCVANQDIRPGLIGSRAAQRRVEMEKKKQRTDTASQCKSLKRVEQERREEGLTTALDTSNKGFAMLQKMGFKPGTSLGKQEGQGRLEPVAVEVKSDRLGLGWQQKLADTRIKRQQQRQQRQQKQQLETDPLKFRQRLVDQRQEKYLQRDLMKSQRVCHDLDAKQGTSEPVESWFWPSYVYNDTAEDDLQQDEEEEEEEECEFEPADQLSILTAYLRDTYHYCIWCGTVYDDERDLKLNCPGPSRADHDD